MTWSDEQQIQMLPNDGDFARAMAFVAGLAEGNTDALDLSTFEAAQAQRLPQMTLALGELLVRGHRLSDDEEALSAWRIQLAQHRSRAEREESE